MTQLETAENNDRAVLLSEEIDFLESLLGDVPLTPDVAKMVMDRRDIVRDGMSTFNFAQPTDTVEGGIPFPADLEGNQSARVSDAYEPDDEVDAEPEDEDHEYSPNRAIDPDLQRCTVCGQPRDECEGEP